MADDYRSLALLLLAERCAVETDRFYNDQPHDPGFCYELWRRALAERSEQAWELVFKQYQGQVLRWVQSNSRFAATGELPSHFVNAAFYRVWRAITPDRFDDYPALNRILDYLRLSVGTALLDFWRREGRHEHSDLEGVAPAATRDRQPTAEEAMQQESAGLKLWSIVAGHFQDEADKIVAEARFVQGMKPAEIVDRWPQYFENTRTIYRRLENLRGRLKRDPELSEMFADA